MNQSLEDALVAENASDKSTMLSILTDVSKAIKEDEIKEILKGTSTQSYKVTDLHSIRALCSYRVKNGHPVFPFKDMKLDEEHIPPSY